MHEKDLAKAERLITKGEPGKRAKFIKPGSKVYVMDMHRINRAKSLLGIKGYYTNIPREQLSNKEVITRYPGLWHVEKAFRMAKSDLGARLVFHRMETAVRTHLLICFVALMMAKAMELRTKRSLRNCIDALWKVTDATLYHPKTEKRTTIGSNIPLETRQILRKLKVPYQWDKTGGGSCKQGPRRDMVYRFAKACLRPKPGNELGQDVQRNDQCGCIARR